MGRSQEMVDVVVQAIKHETKAALLVEDCQGRDAWIPLSHIDEIHRDNPPLIRMTYWIARQKDLV